MVALWWTRRSQSDSVKYWHDEAAKYARNAQLLQVQADHYREAADKHLADAMALRQRLANMPKPVVHAKPNPSDSEAILEVRGIKLAAGDAPTVAKAFLDAEQLPVCIDRTVKLEELVASQEGAIINLQLETGSLRKESEQLKCALESKSKEMNAARAKDAKSKALFCGGGLIAGMLLVLIL